MELLRELLSWVLVVSGGAFCAIGALGLLRLPEFYARTHAAGVTDTLGVALLLLGLMIEPAHWTITVKLVVLLCLLYITSPTAAHALVHAAHASGLRPPLSGDAPTADANAVEEPR